MKALLERLFSEAPTLEGGRPADGQSPALECFVMLLGGGASGVDGVLSTTPEGALRMLSKSHHEGRPLLIEHFFPYESIVSISIRRAITPVPRIHSA
jgi:hypothetical protein